MCHNRHHSFIYQELDMKTLGVRAMRASYDVLHKALEQEGEASLKQGV